MLHCVHNGRTRCWSSSEDVPTVLEVFQIFFLDTLFNCRNRGRQGVLHGSVLMLSDFQLSAYCLFRQQKKKCLDTCKCAWNELTVHGGR